MGWFIGKLWVDFLFLGRLVIDILFIRMCGGVFFKLIVWVGLFFGRLVNKWFIYLLGIFLLFGMFVFI